METIVSATIINKYIKSASKNLAFAQMQGAKKNLQRSNWNEIWIFRNALKFQSQESN